MPITSADDDTFDTVVLAASGPVIVDFWAEWCSSCKQMMPAFEELASEMDGKVAFVKFDAGEHPMAPGRFGVRGLPTMMIFQDGKLLSQKTGAMTKAKIAEWLKSTAPGVARSGTKLQAG